MSSFCGWLLRRMGWSIQGQLPALDRYLIIGAPHTSNWDFVVCMLARFALRMPVRFLAKHQLFKPPFGWFFKVLGGYPVNRSRANNLVSEVVDIYRREPAFVLGLAPEGTRGSVKRWKTGFYHIASQAKVPILMMGVDFGRKLLVFAEPFMTSGDMAADLARIREFYQPMRGRFDRPLPDPLA